MTEQLILSPPPAGDVDGDALVNINDVVALIDVLLSGNMAAVSVENADLNANGCLDIDDLATLIDLLLHNHEL